MKKSELTLGKQVAYWTGAEYKTPKAVEVISLDPQPTLDPWGIQRDDYWQKTPNKVRVRYVGATDNGFPASLRELHPLELIAEMEQQKRDRREALQAREERRDAAREWLTDNNRKLREALEFRGAETDFNGGGITLRLTLDQAKALLEKVTA